MQLSFFDFLFCSLFSQLYLIIETIIYDETKILRRAGLISHIRYKVSTFMIQLVLTNRSDGSSSMTGSHAWHMALAWACWSQGARASDLPWHVRTVVPITCRARDNTDFFFFFENSRYRTIRGSFAKNFLQKTLLGVFLQKKLQTLP